MNFEQARFNMIEQQLRPGKVLDPGVLEVLHVVKREEFVPPALRRLAFADTEVPLGKDVVRPRGRSIAGRPGSDVGKRGRR